MGTAEVNGRSQRWTTRGGVGISNTQLIDFPIEIYFIPQNCLLYLFNHDDIWLESVSKVCQIW